MKIEIIEYYLIGLILTLQLGFFIYTLTKIFVFRKIIPKPGSFSISKVYVPTSDLELKMPNEILNNINNYKKSKEVILDEDIVEQEENQEFDGHTNDDPTKSIEISIIESNIRSKRFNDILNTINTYLLRNRSSASDFNLIKDIVERNTDALEEEINLTISAPLYLGLVGTMLGIVIGLFYMSDFTTSMGDANISDNIGDNISILLGGVKIAMIASLFGLILIILNSSIFYKNARKLIDYRKNEFYSFLQIYLLPVLNQGLGSTFESLQRNLLKFNEELSQNLNGLSGIFSANKEALIAQQDILSKLEKIPVAQMAKYNIKVLKELQNSTGNIEQFNNYLNNINSFVANSNQLVDKSNDLLSRTDNFKDIADNLEYRLTESQKLMEFLSNHFEKLEEHKDFVNRSVADVGISISDTFGQLKEHIQNSTKAVKDFTVDELDALKTALSESKTNLSNLEHLASIMKDVSDFKNSSNTNNEEVKRNLLELNKNMKISTELLDALESTTLTHKSKVFKNSIKNLFSSKK